MYEVFYRFFKRHTSNSLISTLAYAWLLLSSRWRIRECAARRPAYSQGRVGVKVAMICDQMTFEAFRRECGVVCLTPWNWRAVLRETPPDFVLCESAWEGIQGSGACWRGRIYRNHRVKFEHRRILFAILKNCRRQGIPTVFWNKEDPTFWGDQQYDFVDTALRFDYIFTTAEECILRYQELGHRNVQALPFGFSPNLFNPIGSGRMKREAFFAGSWYQDQKERCRDMTQMFQYMEANDVPYTIYNRNYGIYRTDNQFPEPYKSRCRPGIPYTKLDAATKRYLYGLNINTAKDSQTMFARRVYEMMAGNHVVISNRAKGLEREFPDSVWYFDQSRVPDDVPDMRRKNLEHVFHFHTYEKRLNTILRVLGMEERRPEVRLYLLSEEFSGCRVLEIDGIRIERRQFRRGERIEEQLPEDAYAAVLRGGAAEVNWSFLMTQFAYLPKDCGIRWGKAVYEITEDTENWDCVFPVCVLGTGLEHFSESIKKIEL